MKITIFSDVHGNLEPLEKMYSRESDSDLFICLGDVVGYGPESYECLDLINKNIKKTICIIGNHEEMFINGFPEDKCSNLSKNFFYHSYPLFNKNILNFVKKNFVSEYEMKDYTFKHTLNNRYIYEDTEINSLDKNYFIGHSHYQFIKSVGNFKIINTGSLGQNRKNKSLACYANLIEDQIYLKSFYINLDRFLKKMTDAGYPESLINYYKSKSFS
jgi:putative phosphoesterase